MGEEDGLLVCEVIVSVTVCSEGCCGWLVCESIATVADAAAGASPRTWSSCPCSALLLEWWMGGWYVSGT